MPETNKKPLLQTKEEAQVSHEKSDLRSVTKLLWEIQLTLFSEIL